MLQTRRARKNAPKWPKPHRPQGAHRPLSGHPQQHVSAGQVRFSGVFRQPRQANRRSRPGRRRQPVHRPPGPPAAPRTHPDASAIRSGSARRSPPPAGPWSRSHGTARASAEQTVLRPTGRSWYRARRPAPGVDGRSRQRACSALPVPAAGRRRRSGSRRVPRTYSPLTRICQWVQCGYVPGRVGFTVEVPLEPTNLTTNPPGCSGAGGSGPRTTRPSAAAAASRRDLLRRPSRRGRRGPARGRSAGCADRWWPGSPVRRSSARAAPGAAASPDW